MDSEEIILLGNGEQEKEKVKIGHFHKLLGKIMTSTSVHQAFPWAVEISFLHTKVCGNAIPIIRVFNVEININSRAGFFIYFMKIPTFYLFLRKIYGYINKKSRAGKNGYFYIKKNPSL